jgi:hypothetical protein
MVIKLNEQYSSIMLKTVNSDGTYYLIKSANRNKSFWNKSISYVNEFAKKESALNKLYKVLQKLPDNAFYDSDDISDFESFDDIENAKFAKFYITDTSGNTIEDISDEVKDHLLQDDKFIDSVLDDFDDDELDEAFIHDDIDEIDRSNAVKFNSSLKDRVKVGSLFLSKNGVGEDYKVVDIYSGGRGSYYVTLKIIKDSYGAKYSSAGRKIYSVPISNLYNMLFIE